MNNVDLGKSFLKFKNNLFMNEESKQIAFSTGYGKCLADILAYLKRKSRNGDNMSIVDVLDEFVKPKIEENTNRLTEINNSLVNIDDLKGVNL